jgi:protein CpxP
MARGGGRGGRGGHGMKKLFRQLDLTDEQKQAIRGLMLEYRKQTQKARTGLMTIRDEKKTMLMSGDIDMKKLADLDEQSVKLKTEVMRAKLKMNRDRLKLLTPEQLDKLGEFMIMGGEKGFGGPGRMGRHRRAERVGPGWDDSSDDI